jgi:hypothetical protein
LRRPETPTDVDRTDHFHRAPERRAFTATTEPLIVKAMSSELVRQ